MTASNTWPYDEITDVNVFAENAQILTRAAQAYPDASYGDILAQLSEGQSALDVFRLTLGLWPD